MARIRFTQDYDGHSSGEISEVPGGLASALIVRRVAELAPAGAEPTPITVTTEAADKPKRSHSRKK